MSPPGKRDFREFLHKLTWKNGGRPAVPQVPPTTPPVRSCCWETFPDARFVHIHRHPYEVFPSLCHTMKTVMAAFGVCSGWTSRGLRTTPSRPIVASTPPTFAQVGAIPAECLHEISYEELSSEPLNTLSATYSALDLPEFELVRPQIEGYLAELSSYKRNKYDELSPEIKQRLQAEWGPIFERWGYAP